MPRESPCSFMATRRGFIISSLLLWRHGARWFPGELWTVTIGTRSQKGNNNKTKQKKTPSPSPGDTLLLRTRVAVREQGCDGLKTAKGDGGAVWTSSPAQKGSGRTRRVNARASPSRFFSRAGAPRGHSLFHLRRTQSSADFPIGRLAAQPVGLTRRRRVERVSERSRLTGDGQMHIACAIECSVIHT